MSFNKKTARFLLVPMAIGALAGCQQDTADNKKAGNYASARHNTVGSNIPQRNSVDSTGATYDPNQFQNFQQQQGNSTGRGFQGGAH